MEENPYKPPVADGGRSFRVGAFLLLIISIAFWIDSHFYWSSFSISRDSHAVIWEQLLGHVELRIEQLEGGGWGNAVKGYRVQTTGDDEIKWESYDLQFAGIGLAWDHEDPSDVAHTWSKLSLPYWVIAVSLIAANRRFFSERLRQLTARPK
jgi:hypothetical protein